MLGVACLLILLVWDLSLTDVDEIEAWDVPVSSSTYVVSPKQKICVLLHLIEAILQPICPPGA